MADIDFSKALNLDLFNEMEIPDGADEDNPNLFVPERYEYYGRKFYRNGFLGNSIESLFRDEDSGDFIYRVAHIIPIGDYANTYYFQWFKSIEGKSGEIRKDIEDAIKREEVN